MATRVIPKTVRSTLVARLQHLEGLQIPELEGQFAASSDPDVLALLTELRRERDQIVDALASEHGSDDGWDPRQIEVGDTVRVREIGSLEEQSFTIVPARVGSRVSDGWVTDISPLGQVLVGAQRGHTVVVDSPSGSRRFEVVDFREG